MIKVLNLFYIVCICNLFVIVWCKKNNDNNAGNDQEIWKQDLTDTFKIDGTDQGIQKVNLKCGSNSMNVVLETEKPFTGVMYTRGSFYKQSAPCFVKPENTNIDTHSLAMNFPLDQCQTQNDSELYTNIVVIQNDPAVITPGDSAFSLECDFRQPRNLNVEATIQTRDRTAQGSKITLTSPDPSLNKESAQNSVHSNTDTVQYVPKHVSTTDNMDTQMRGEPVRFGTVEDVTLTLNKDEL